MSDYSFPKINDDIKFRLVYTVAAEFIYRLDEYLESEHREADFGPLPVDTIAVVSQCSLAAMHMFCTLVHPWTATSTGTEAMNFVPEHLDACCPVAASMIVEAAEVLKARFQPVNAHPALTRFPPKWQSMFTLGTEFFLRLGAVTETFLQDAKTTVDDFEVEILRACLDSAMGMVYELKSVVWPECHEMPARVLLDMHAHVLSCRLEDAGAEAVSLIEEVYEAVAGQLMGAE